jgi:hypothetical protein
LLVLLRRYRHRCWVHLRGRDGRKDGEMSTTADLRTHCVEYVAYGVAFQLSSNNEGILAAMVSTVPFGADACEHHDDDALIVSLDELSPHESYCLCIGDDAPISADELKPMLNQLRIESLSMPVSSAGRGARWSFPDRALRASPRSSQHSSARAPPTTPMSTPYSTSRDKSIPTQETCR